MFVYKLRKEVEAVDLGLYAWKGGGGAVPYVEVVYIYIYVYSYMPAYRLIQAPSLCISTLALLWLLSTFYTFIFEQGFSMQDT